MATIGPFGHVNSMTLCVLAPTSTLLAELLFHVSTVECTCHRHANSMCPLVTRPQSSPKRWPSSLPASHQRRPLQVAIFIADGTNKYRLNKREARYPTSERITTSLALHGDHSTTTLMAAFQLSVSINIGNIPIRHVAATSALRACTHLRAPPSTKSPCAETRARARRRARVRANARALLWWQVACGMLQAGKHVWPYAPMGR